VHIKCASLTGLLKLCTSRKGGTIYMYYTRVALRDIIRLTDIKTHMPCHRDALQCLLYESVSA
jgi:hypothetical protein